MYSSYLQILTNRLIINMHSKNTDTHSVHKSKPLAQHTRRLIKCLMQRQGWALTLIFPNKSLDATCNSSKCTHTHLSDSRPCMIVTQSPRLSSTLYFSLSLLLLITFFSSVSRHLPHLPLSASLPLLHSSIIPVAVSLHHLQFYSTTMFI